MKLGCLSAKTITDWQIGEQRFLKPVMSVMFFFQGDDSGHCKDLLTSLVDTVSVLAIILPHGYRVCAGREQMNTEYTWEECGALYGANGLCEKARPIRLSV